MNHETDGINLTCCRCGEPVYLTWVELNDYEAQSRVVRCAPCDAEAADEENQL